MQFKRRDKDDNLYGQLQSSSLEMLQKLSGNIWTDFNEHDPGITILDVLNYALLETKYRMDFEFEEYLVNPDLKGIDYTAIGLLPGDELFAPSIVTPQDYEHLIKQTLPAVKTCKVTVTDDNHYRIQVALHEDGDVTSTIQSIRELYHSNRNLCENLKDIQLVTATRNRDEVKLNDDLIFHQSDENREISPRLQTAYGTIQHEFPDCYGINRMGLPAGATPEQKVSALQLKSYLLIFDYLLSGVGQQTKNLHRFLNLKEHEAPRFSVDINVEGLDLLLDREKVNESELLKKDDFTERKSAYYDLLDAFYGEDSHQISIANKKLPKTDFNIRRAGLIRRFPELNTHRFRSFNLLDEKMECVAGIKQFTSAILGCEQQSERVLTNVFSRHNLKLVSDEVFFGEMQGLLNIEYFTAEQNQQYIEPKLLKIEKQPIAYNERKFAALRNQLNFFRHNILFVSFLEHGMHIENYRMYHVQANNTYLLLYQHPGRKNYINMGLFFSEQRLVETLHNLLAFVEKLSCDSAAIYVVEHILLQQAEATKTSDANRLTIVIPQWTEHLYHRDNYEGLIRERLPVHLEVDFCWLPIEVMYRFEQIYFWWRRAWATNNQELIKLFSTKIRTELATIN
ncbi:MAG: hypothetical protein H6Q17_417 [Bacteroidetes bacterium]|nr:hypothetical protein [Bacteroidota bacterium]